MFWGLFSWNYQELLVPSTRLIWRQSGCESGWNNRARPATQGGKRDRFFGGAIIKRDNVKRHNTAPERHSFRTSCLHMLTMSTTSHSQSNVTDKSFMTISIKVQWKLLPCWGCDCFFGSPEKIPQVSKLTLWLPTAGTTLTLILRWKTGWMGLRRGSRRTKPAPRRCRRIKVRRAAG